MKKKVYTYIITVLVAGCFFAGCGKDAQENRTSYRAAGIEAMKQGDYAGAVTAFDAALSQKIGSVDADDIDISYYKAAAQYAGGDTEGALATYQAIVAFLPKEAAAYYQMGCLYLKNGETETAKQNFDKAVQYNANDYELYIHIYENLAAAGYAEDARAYVDKAFLIKGNELVNKEYRGKLYYLLGEYANAITELVEAKETGSSICNLYLGQTYAAMGQTEDAKNYLETYLATDSENSIALNTLGLLMLEEGEYAEAVSYFEKAYASEKLTNQQEVMRNLVKAYEYDGSFDKAWELIRQYVTLYSQDEKAQREYIFLENRQPKQGAEVNTENE